MNTESPLYFIFDVMRNLLNLLDQYRVAGVSILTWIVCFILVGMVVSVFWKGARG